MNRNFLILIVLSIVACQRSHVETFDVGSITHAPTLPCVTLSSDDSAIHEAEYLRILDSESWAKLWQRHKGVPVTKDYGFYYNELELPVIDFKSYMVLALFDGDSYNVTSFSAKSIVDDGSQLVLKFARDTFQTAGPAPSGGAKKASAYAFLVVARSNKKVVLEQRASGLKRGTVKWVVKKAIPAL